MSTPRTLQPDDRDRLFADWAEVVLFRQVACSYDPARGELDADATDSELPAIPGAAVSSPIADAAQQAVSLDRTFLVRSEDLPEGASLTTSRIVHAGQEFAIVGADQSAVAGVLVLNTRLLV